MTDEEIRKGEELHPGDFGDELWRSVVDNPQVSKSGRLVFAYRKGRELVWTAIF